VRTQGQPRLLGHHQRTRGLAPRALITRKVVIVDSSDADARYLDPTPLSGELGRSDHGG